MRFANVIDDYSNNNFSIILKNNFNKLSKFCYENRAWFLFCFAIFFMFLAPESQAQAWADPIISGLKMLCYPIACICGLWIVYGIWFQNKRLQDMIPWFIGAALLVALPELAKMIESAAKF